MQPAASTIETPLRRRGALPQAALWCLPLLLCLAFFWRSLFGWFQQDDFAWLYLRLQLHSAAGLWRLLMDPRAEGTIRPLSERLFFIVFRSLFGLNAFPYHLFVLLTQLANLALLLALARRLTASLGAASLTAALWAVNVSLLTPMMWASAYNQILCAFFFLSSLLLFLKHVETGRWRFYAAQGCTFLLGFGAHESMAVFPLVLLAYCALLNRRHTWKAALLCIPSALHTAARSRPVCVPPGSERSSHAKGLLELGAGPAVVCRISALVRTRKHGVLGSAHPGPGGGNRARRQAAAAVSAFRVGLVLPDAGSGRASARPSHAVLSRDPGDRSGAGCRLGRQFCAAMGGSGLVDGLFWVLERFPSPRGAALVRS